MTLRRTRLFWLWLERDRYASLSTGMMVMRKRQIVGKFWKPCASYYSNYPLSGGDSGKLIEIRAWEHKVSSVTTRGFQIINLSDGCSTAPPPNDHPSSDKGTRTTDPNNHPLNTSSVSPSPVPRTPVERVAKYQGARERIFGPSRMRMDQRLRHHRSDLFRA